MSVESKVRAVTTLRLKEMKDRGEKIAMLTSYDYSMAKIVDAAGVDVILVGDSAANVMAGVPSNGRWWWSTCLSEPIRAIRRWPSTRPSGS